MHQAALASPEALLISGPGTVQCTQWMPIPRDTFLASRVSWFLWFRWFGCGKRGVPTRHIHGRPGVSGLGFL
eukprot:6418430-Pyramimonas_sp.AAC.1